MKTLDRTRPFGEIFGAVHGSARYEQDGVLFDSGGNEIADLAGGGKTIEDETVPRKRRGSKVPE